MAGIVSVSPCQSASVNRGPALSHTLIGSILLEFESLVWIWKGSDAAGRWYFVTVPDDLSPAIRGHALGSPRGFGSVKVEARIHAVVWRTSVFPLKRGGYLLPLKADVRKRARLSAGDEVRVTLDLL